MPAARGWEASGNAEWQNVAIKQTRGLGLVYQPTYLDKRTGEHKTAATWWIQYYIRGRRYPESSGSTNRPDAVNLLKRRIGDVGQGRGIGPQAEKTTFEHLAQILIDDYRANGRPSLKRIKAAIGHLRKFFGDAYPLDMTSDRIASSVAYRQEENAAAATVNRELAALKRAFRLAEKAGKVLKRPEVSMLREDNRRKGFFEAVQYRAVVEHLPGELKPVIQIAYITGWRIASEILTRQKHHVNLDAGWLRLEPGETKNGEGRNFPLTPELREILARQIEKTREVEPATGRIIPWLFHRDRSPIEDYRGSRYGNSVDSPGPVTVPARHELLRLAQATVFRHHGLDVLFSRFGGSASDLARSSPSEKS